ncbi:hypothetical protein HELRODRAFT_194049 [Helobdella robusta]|uniref:Endonuclease/exonuclease/phosphatase domain-containing protein n=1 Tax=Helobdella robusta TaxID=6412 RepID=T1FVM2_HELRO|nr:hypothetical protein HELRODRAFT_194049 [Helobdella robusta]ESN93524.1 hypothetical protein HELRODRAFT_194049 [Helobdella robusta]
MKLGLLNVRSLSNKSVVIYDALLHNKIDVMVLTETWHRASNDESVKSALPPGYGYVDAVREFDPAHGDLDGKYTSHSDGDISSGLKRCHVVEGLIVNTVPLLIAGDFNIHLEDADDLNARRMEDFFATFDMIRFVHGPTHVKNGTLDFVAATSSYEITDVTVGTPGEFSDHALITCLLPMQKDKQRPNQIIRRTIEINGYSSVNNNTASLGHDIITTIQTPKEDQSKQPQTSPSHNTPTNSSSSRPRVVGSGRLIDKTHNSSKQQPRSSNSYNTKYKHNSIASKLHHNHFPTSGTKPNKIKPNINNSAIITTTISTSPEKPLKSILKKPSPDKIGKKSEISGDVILAVITTPGNDAEDGDSYDNQVAPAINRYDLKKEAAICDWLEQSEQSIKMENNNDDGDDNDEEEWEDVDDDENINADDASNHDDDDGDYDDDAIKNKKKLSRIDCAVEHGSKETNAINIDIIDDNEESEEAFEKFIEENTLHVDIKSPVICDWASEMDKLSQERKKEAQLEQKDEKGYENNESKTSFNHSLSISESAASDVEKSFNNMPDEN